MKKNSIVLLILFTVSLAFATETDLENQWFKKDLSVNERNVLVEQSKKEPFEKIAPIVFKVLNECPFLDGCITKYDPPWSDDRYSSDEKTHLMASEVMNHFKFPKNDLQKAKVILSLLQKTKLEHEKSSFIAWLNHYHWCPDAENVLLDIATNKNTALYIRAESIKTLLNHCDVNSYMPLAIEIIYAHKKEQRPHEFNYIINQGNNKLLKLDRKNMQLLLNTGFNILNEIPENELKSGYHLASHLGGILKIKNKFKPDQSAKKYQGKYRLTDDYFIDTVKNALDYYSSHKKEIQNK